MCSRIGTIVKQRDGVITAIKVSCRSWGCPDCRKDRARQLIMDAKEGKPERFITLTVNPNWFSSPLERAQKLVAAWRLIRRRYLKLHPNADCEFMAVFEKTKLGEPHLHIVQRGGYIPQRWLSAQLNELVGAKIVDIRYIRSQKKVAEYVSKYVGKEPFQFGTLKRYWRSKCFHEKTQREKRKERNAGARFFILDCHWKAYMKWIRAHFNVENIEVKRKSFTMAWPDERPPPWCVTVEPICC